jgi:uncharacterized membrane protein YgcG
MELAMRKRPRRLVVVAAVIALSAALFAAVVTPLRAQQETFVSFDLPGKKDNASARGADITANGEDRTFIIGAKKKRTQVRGMDLSQVIDLANAKVNGIGVYQLRRDGQPLYVTEGTALFFYVEGGTMHWLLYDKNNRAQEFGDASNVVLKGFKGELLDVTVSATPEKLRAGDDVTLSADPTGGVNGEGFSYRWVDGDGKVVARTKSFTTTMKKKGQFDFYVDVVGEKGSRGTNAVTLDVGAKKKQKSSSGGSGGSGGSSGGSGGSGGGGSSGGSGGGSTVPPSTGTTPPFNPGTTPPNSTTPALPPPSTSPPPSGDPGRGPNLDPNAPPATSTPSGQEVTGVLVSASTPPKAGGKPGAKAPNAAANKPKANDKSVDWRMVGGIALTLLLLILGALRERRPIRRLLPQPQ